MGKIWRSGRALATALLLCAGAQAAETEQLYRAAAIVTGQDERNRPSGFRDCLGEVLVRVSGDPGLLENPQMAALRERAGTFVASFSYRDRMEGIPVHDEQGTYDRPYDLTCFYEPVVIDRILASLGSRPWQGERPALAVLLRVKQGNKQFTLTSDGSDGDYMRQAFQAAAESLAMEVVFPAERQVEALPGAADGIASAEPVGATASWTTGDRQLLRGRIGWSDTELGWIADWQLPEGGVSHRWQIRGVSFDEAFRAAVQGSAQVLSGNGSPNDTRAEFPWR